MADAQTHLDELLTATTNYRESLADEIMERVNLLEGQLNSMSDAASILRGLPVGERQTTTVNEELAAEQEQALAVEQERVAALRKECADLRRKLTNGEPLSAKLAQTEEEVQEARELAAVRQRELERAVARIEELEAKARESSSDALATPGLEPHERHYVGDTKMKDSGPKGTPRPAFSFPRGVNPALFRQGMEHMNERFRVYLLEDGSVLYKPTGIIETGTGRVQPLPGEEEVPPQRRTADQTYSLARSPKPIAEMRAPQAEKEERLVKEVEYLIEHHSRGGFNTSDLAEDMKVNSQALRTDLVELEQRGIVRRTGELVFPRGVAEARRRNPQKAGGRPAVEYALADDLRREPPMGDVQRQVRDYMVESLPHGDLASPPQIAAATELSQAVVLEALEALVKRGSIQDDSPSADMRLFKYAGQPKQPGKAAEMDRSRRPTETQAPVQRGGQAKTAQVRANNKDVQDLINAAQRAGASVKHEASGHFAVTIPGSGKRILISSTPSNPRSVLNDRARLRRAGLAIA